jgi:LDH2 family malate/lactate/ureidoglycolate dehydrogenase
MSRSGAEKETTYGQWWGSTEEFVNVRIEPIERICHAALEQAGATPDDAHYITEICIEKAISGDDTRGIGRVLGQIRAALSGTLDMHPDIQVLRETPATALIDGGEKASGTLVCRRAMDMAIEKARTQGIGWVGARAQGELLVPYVKQATSAGMVGMVFIQSFATVAPLGGFQPLLGNAPVAFGVPAGKNEPFIIDMSITQTSASGVFLSAKQDQQVPENLILDEHGDPSTTARDFPDMELLEKGPMAAKGSLLPLGGGHKGYALVLMVGLLSALLSDTSFPWEMAHGMDSGGRYGSLLMAVDPGAFTDEASFRARSDEFLDVVKGSPKKAGVDEILYPGQRSQRLIRERREAGDALIPASHYHGLVELAKEIGLDGAL